MKSKHSLQRFTHLCLVLMLGLAGCTLHVQAGPREWTFNFGATPTVQPTYTPRPTYTPLPTYTPRPSFTPLPTYTFLPLGNLDLWKTPQPTATLGMGAPDEGEISQYASSASASSQVSGEKYSAMQAVGAPDTTSCRDIKAWASYSSNGKDWLLLTYDQAVIPTRILIRQANTPGSIILVEVLTEVGAAIPVYTAQPQRTDDCFALLDIPVEGVQARVRSLRVTVDQAQLGNWDMIDAVQLIGKP